jgi:hypothetical protein
MIVHHSDKYVGINFKSLMTGNEEKKVKKNFFSTLTIHFYTNLLKLTVT